MRNVTRMSVLPNDPSPNRKTGPLNPLTTNEPNRSGVLPSPRTRRGTSHQLVSNSRSIRSAASRKSAISDRNARTRHKNASRRRVHKVRVIRSEDKAAKKHGPRLPTGKVRLRAKSAVRRINRLA
jgi:hypothetical protein